MKRKIIRLGTATLVASLPAKWTQKFGMKAGDYIEVTERNKDLVIATENELAKNEKVLDFRNSNTLLVKEYLHTAYDLGYDVIEILHDPLIQEYKSAKKVRSAEFIQKIINTLIGMEIIEQSEKRTVLHDLGGVSDEEMENVLRRIFLLVKLMGQECCEALHKKDAEVLKGMSFRLDNIMKFILYYKRILNKKGYKDFNKTPLVYEILTHLKTIADVHKYIASESLQFKKAYSAQALEVYRDVNASFELLTTLFYDFKQESALRITGLREEAWKKIEAVKAKRSFEDALLHARLAVIVLTITAIARSRFGLEL